MTEQHGFIILLLAICAYAVSRGGAPERLGAVAFLAATLMSVLSLPAVTVRFRQVEGAELLVDLVLLLFLVGLGLRSTRWWPLFQAGLQIDAIAVHMLRASVPDIHAYAYLYGTALWSYPMLIVLAIGTWRHRRRLQTRGSDPAWIAREPSAGRRGNHPR